jgi:hypothetical protein
MMMAVAEGNADVPRAVGLAVHGIDVVPPMIEVTDQGDAPGFGGKAEEVDRLGHVAGGVTAFATECRVRFIVRHQRQH